MRIIIILLTASKEENKIENGYQIMKYLTKNKTTVLSVLIENKGKHLTIEEIDELLKGKVPLASIYRIVDSLVDEGLVQKYTIDRNSSACFQYIGDGIAHSHFHLLCVKCGKLIHLECHEVNHLIEHIESEHGFKVDISKVNLYGICEECQKKGNL